MTYLDVTKQQLINFIDGHDQSSNVARNKSALTAYSLDTASSSSDKVTLLSLVDGTATCAMTYKYSTDTVEFSSTITNTTSVITKHDWCTHANNKIDTLDFGKLLSICVLMFDFATAISSTACHAPDAASIATATRTEIERSDGVLKAVQTSSLSAATIATATRTEIERADGVLEAVKTGVDTLLESKLDPEAAAALSTKLNALSTTIGEANDIVDTLPTKVSAAAVEASTTILTRLNTTIVELNELLTAKAAIFAASDTTIKNFEKSYADWVSNLTSVTTMLKTTSNSAMVVSYETQQSINAARDVANQLETLMSNTAGFQMWLDTKMQEIQNATNTLNGLTVALAKNLELKEAYTERDVNDRALALEEGKHQNYAAYAAVGVSFLSLIVSLLCRPKKGGTI